MEAGVYVGGRSINSVPYGTHLFLILIPNRKDTLNGIMKTHIDIDFNYLILGAYNTVINGKVFLRASKFQPSDEISFLRSIKVGSYGSGIKSQIEPVKIPACFVNEDHIILEIFKCFIKYKTFEGTKNELIYPDTLAKQLDSQNYNSNSWALSCVSWGCEPFGKKVLDDFDGFEVGSERVIPRTFFKG